MAERDASGKMVVRVSRGWDVTTFPQDDGDI